MLQQDALHILKSGGSVFLTGPAGSGKTYVLNQYIKYLRENGVEPAITASTGIAGTHMGGMTIHAWSGLGIKDSIDKNDLETLYSRNYLKERILNTNVLIIDEVSMLHHFRLDLLNLILRFFRKNDEPFGGMQVILCGDFFQLPPVSRFGEPVSRFVYHSDAWHELNPKICYLEEQYRQTDRDFTDLLNAMRSKNIDESHFELLKLRMIKDGKKKTTRLYAHNTNVDSENEIELGKIEEDVFEFSMSGKGNPKIVEALKKSCLAPEKLKLKRGAKVMFVKNNFEEGYVNGTTGVVKDCNDYEIKVETKNGKIIDVKKVSWSVDDEGRKLGEISQYPLRLAWAITIHKSQGMSLDEAEVDLSRVFERGMGYVALSRVRTLKGLILTGFSNNALQVNDEAYEMDQQFKNSSLELSRKIQLVGEKEGLEMYQKFLKEIKPVGKNKKTKLNTVEETKKLILKEMTLKEMSEIRNLKSETILDHIEKIKEGDSKINIHYLKKTISNTKFHKIYQAFQKFGTIEGGKRPLAPVKNLLGSGVSYEDLRLVRLFL